MKNRIELEFFGQFCAPTISGKHPETFSITAHMKEAVNPQILEQASNDLFRRLPFLSGRLNQDGRGFFYEIIEEPPKIIFENETSGFNMYYKQDKGHILRVLYAKQYIKAETAHFTIDGRGLSKFLNALLVRYFEILGVNADKSGIIDCNDTFKPEEMEDAALRFANPDAPAKPKTKEPKRAYKANYKRNADTWTASKIFELDKIKSSAKSQGLTVTGELLRVVFQVLAEERGTSKKPIVASLPVDCRRFFPSPTLRNFDYVKNITMPESSESMAQQLKSQFAEVDTAFIQTGLNEMKQTIDMFGRMSFNLQKFIIKWAKRLQSKKSSFIFSSLGLVKLPKEIETRIENMEFLCSPEEGQPYTFSCVSISNALTLSVSAVTPDKVMVENIFHRLEG